MRRFFTEPQNICEDKAYIFEDSKHIERVLRMKSGDELLLFDGTGFEYLAKIASIEKDRCSVIILNKSVSLSEPEVHISLFQGIPKSGKMETIIQKSVELGVYEIIPVIMDRCVVKINGDTSSNEKTKRWNKVSVEAAKQCGRGLIPKVHEPVSFSKAAEMMAKLDVPLMPYELLGHNGEKGLNEILNENRDAKTYGILIGPEGGFSDEEAELALKQNISMIGLGRRILRTETVSGALISIIMYSKNEM